MNGPYFAEHGAIRHESVRGFLFSVDPPSFADDVAKAMNAVEAPVTELVSAAREAIDWHEAQRKAASKRPQTGLTPWDISEHRDQASRLSKALEAFKSETNS